MVLVKCNGAIPRNLGEKFFQAQNCLSTKPRFPPPGTRSGKATKKELPLQSKGPQISAGIVHNEKVQLETLAKVLKKPQAK